MCAVSEQLVVVSILKVVKEAEELLPVPGGGGVCILIGVPDSSTPRLRFREPPRPGAGGDMLCCNLICFASASERVNDLSHSKTYQGIRPNNTRARLPGREQVNGFSPVCERICDIRAKRDV